MASNNWMSSVSDSQLIDNLVIPGTHDSGTYTLLAQAVPYALTQTLGGSVYDQLVSGVRALDIRVKAVGNSLLITHGDVLTGVTFEKVKADIQRFLSENPTETIIATLKLDGTQLPWPFGKSASELLAASMKDPAFARTWLGYSSGQDPANIDYNSLTLADVRGKVVIVDRTGNKLGLDASNWGDNTTFAAANGTYAAQDLYSSPAIGEKIDAINKFSQQKNSGLNFNFTSAATSINNLLVGPKDYAVAINPYIADQLDGQAAGILADGVNSSTLKGVFFTDFALADKYSYAAYNNGSNGLASSNLSTWLPTLLYSANKSASLEISPVINASSLRAMELSSPNSLQPSLSAALSSIEVANAHSNLATTNINSEFNIQNVIVKTGQLFNLSLNAHGYKAGDAIYFKITSAPNDQLSVSNIITDTVNPDIHNSSDAIIGKFVVGQNAIIQDHIKFAGNLQGLDKFSIELFSDPELTTPTGVATSFYVADKSYGTLKLESASNNDFVSSIYADVLHRSPSMSEINFWVDKIDKGLDKNSVLIDFLTSEEWAKETSDNSVFVKALYADLLEKYPDTSDLTYWTDALTKGASRLDVIKSFINSQGFQKLINIGTDSPDIHSNIELTNSDNSAFMTSLYTEIMHRAPDLSGFNYWVSKLDTGTSRAAETVAFLTSKEFLASVTNVKEYVDDLYSIILNRAPDPTGEQYWCDQISSGVTQEQVAQAILHSNELKMIMGVNPNSSIPLLDNV